MSKNQPARAAAMLPLCSCELFTACLPTRLPSILLLGLLYVVYVLTGGAVFWKLEGPAMEGELRKIREEVVRLRREMPCLNQDNIVGAAEVLHRAASNGISLKDNHTGDGVWKFTTSAVFAATVVTTIGYGNISPSTTAGQIFCVFFALFGIPLNVVVLNKIGKYMLAIARMVTDLIQKKTNQKRGINVFIHLLSFVCGVMVFFVVPMVVFKFFEGWSYSQAIYYCFITLSTIGFGDYVAGSSLDDNAERVYPDWYGPLMGVWIFFGLAWLSLLINHGIEILEELNKQWKFGEEQEPDQSEEPPAADTQMTEIQTPSDSPHPLDEWDGRFLLPNPSGELSGAEEVGLGRGCYITRWGVADSLSLPPWRRSAGCSASCDLCHRAPALTGNSPSTLALVSQHAQGLQPWSRRITAGAVPFEKYRYALRRTRLCTFSPEANEPHQRHVRSEKQADEVASQRWWEHGELGNIPYGHRLQAVDTRGPDDD
ncbi:potassium channel subfamily K member 16 [Conger conger]|uniref:potassium channel subfamily K member 16 n=1 Tax=Conger conger TaxID=82655 RepID=UPI002A59907D|nr:potassium channel subfamily K member 16 [Conger conger]